MAMRLMSTSSTNSENEAVYGKDMSIEHRIEVTKRPALGSIANKVEIHPCTGSQQNVTKQMAKISAVVVSKSPQVVLSPSCPGGRVMPVTKPVMKVQAVAAETVNSEKSRIPMDISKIDDLTSAFSSRMLDIEDVDAGDECNPQLVSCYVNVIYDYMYRIEDSFAIRPNYLEGQVVTARMRTILVDWLVQVASRFELLPETLYVGVKIIDRYLQNNAVSKEKLQLVGITALFIACKYEEMYSPSITDFSYITDKAFTTSEIRKMEVVLLKNLAFQLGCPLPLHFLRRNSKAGGVDAVTHMLAKYLCELTMPEYTMVHCKPSQIAAAALYLSITLMKCSTWTATLVHYSKYTEQDLKPLVCKLAAIVIKTETSKYQAVRNKYASSKFMKISGIRELKGNAIKALAKLST